MGWLAAAYIVVWIVFFLYLLSLDRKQKALADEISNLRAKLGGE